jgi:hypothetical protein
MSKQLRVAGAKNSAKYQNFEAALSFSLVVVIGTIDG